VPFESIVLFESNVLFESKVLALAYEQSAHMLVAGRSMNDC
jgi:hypothetical protein